MVQLWCPMNRRMVLTNAKVPSAFMQLQHTEVSRRQRSPDFQELWPISTSAGSSTLTWSLPRVTCFWYRHQCPWHQASPAWMQQTPPAMVATWAAGDNHKEGQQEKPTVTDRTVSRSPWESSPEESPKSIGSQRRRPDLPSHKSHAELEKYPAHLWLQGSIFPTPAGLGTQRFYICIMVTGYQGYLQSSTCSDKFVPKIGF